MPRGGFDRSSLCAIAMRLHKSENRTRVQSWPPEVGSKPGLLPMYGFVRHTVWETRVQHDVYWVLKGSKRTR